MGMYYSTPDPTAEKLESVEDRLRKLESSLSSPTARAPPPLPQLTSKTIDRSPQQSGSSENLKRSGDNMKMSISPMWSELKEKLEARRKKIEVEF